MLNKAMLFIFLVIIQNAYAELECTDKGQIRYYVKRKEILEKASYCTDVKRIILVSKECYQSKCYNKFKNVEVDLNDALESPIGNPSFELCRRLDGSPQIIEFKMQGQWFSLDRCLFDEGQWFVDAGYLFKLVKIKD
ncbi:MAG: hypothetical protein AB7I27_09410 [Bacteriovoracaceae bacterium]